MPAPASLRKTALLCCLFSLLLFPSAGQVKFSALVNNKTINTQDYLQVQFTVENAVQVTQFVPPVFTYFQVAQGPDQTSGWSLVNGELKQYITFSYLLKPMREGKLVLPAASVKADGQLFRSEPIIIEVTNSPQASSAYGRLSDEKTSFDEFILKKGETIQDKIKNNLFVRLEVSRTSCYEGEPVVATYKLYTRLKSESRVVKRPSFNGFSVYDMIDPESGNPAVERYRGKEYHVYLLRKIQLYPLQSGTLELEPLEVENTVTFVRAENVSGKYALSDLLKALVEDQPSPGTTIKERITLSNKAVSINVKPLPEVNRPGQFGGAVGKFAIISSVKKSSIHRNDVYNLNVILKGSGNLPVIASPTVHWPGSFEAYEPLIREEIVKEVAPMKGEKIFTIPFSPRQEGDYIIPAVELSYFDPDSGKYRLAKSDSIKVVVVAEKVLEKKNFSENIKAFSDNIIERKALFLFLLGGAVVLATGGLLVYRNRKRRLASLRAEAMRKAAEVAAFEAATNLPVMKDYLAKAWMALEEKQFDKFYQQLSQGLWSFMSDHLKIPLSGLNKPRVRTELSKVGVYTSCITEFTAIVTSCEDALYTPFGQEFNPHELYDRAEKLIDELRMHQG